MSLPGLKEAEARKAAAQGRGIPQQEPQSLEEWRARVQAVEANAAQLIAAAQAEADLYTGKFDKLNAQVEQYQLALADMVTAETVEQRQAIRDRFSS